MEEPHTGSGDATEPLIKFIHNTTQTGDEGHDLPPMIDGEWWMDSQQLMCYYATAVEC